MSVKKKPMNSIVKGGLLLTISSFIAKLLSALYKVPFQNLTGDAGFYVYQQIYPIYGLAASLSLTGIPAFVSKIVSEAQDEKSLEQSLQELNTWLVSTGLLLFIFLQSSAEIIATAMGDPGLGVVIQSVAYFFLLLPFLAFIRGCFQGVSDMLPTSVSQVVEQLIRVFILLGVAVLFTQKNWTIYEMGAYAYHSAWISGLVGLLTLVLFLRRKKSTLRLIETFKLRGSIRMGRRLFSEGLLLVAVSSLMVLLQFIDSFTVYNGLIDAGWGRELSMAMKGVYDRGQPLIQLGLVVGMGFSMSSLPVLRKWAVANHWEEWLENATSVIKITTILSSAATVGLIAVMPWMNETLFTDRTGTKALQLLIISVFLASLIYAIHMILQSTNTVGNSLLIMLAGLIFKLVMNQFIVSRTGILGSSAITIMSLLIILILKAQLLPGTLWKRIFSDHFILKLGTLLLGMYIIVNGGLTFIENSFIISGRMSSLLLTLVGVAIGALFFLIGAVYTKLLDNQTLEQIPFTKIVEKLKRK